MDVMWEMILALEHTQENSIVVGDKSNMLHSDSRGIQMWPETEGWGVRNTSG